MLAGVTIVDPATTWIDADVELEADAVIHPFTVIRGKSRVAAGAEVGPQVVAIDAEIGPRAMVGPFCYLRPGAVLEAGASRDVRGNQEFAHRRRCEGAAPFLHRRRRYRRGTNIGAGAITASYRPELGSGKQRTTIGRNVHTWSQNVFVAPVTATTMLELRPGRSSPKTSRLERSPSGARQVNKEGYDDRKRHD